ncbi:enterocin 1071A family bacteriocin [Enterococcus casseliflavus]|uniref:enterocin 1071A family bacteriocin n=1 Tax=Enterococcus casseliflavus TaxID=37734 RepID=UPI0035D81E35
MEKLTEKELKKCVGGSVWSDIGQGVGKVGYWVLKGLGNMSDVNQADRINRKKKR